MIALTAHEKKRGAVPVPETFDERRETLLELAQGDALAFLEACPRCGAEPLGWCVQRGREVTEAHRGRVEIASLRRARNWVPKPGDLVLPDNDPHPAYAATFVGWTPEGEALCVYEGERWKVDALQVLPADLPPHVVARGVLWTFHVDPAVDLLGIPVASTYITRAA